MVIRVSGSHWFALQPRGSIKDAILRLGRRVNADLCMWNGVFVGTDSPALSMLHHKVPALGVEKGENLVTVRLINSGGRPSFVKGKPYCMAMAKTFTPVLQWRDWGC